MLYVKQTFFNISIHNTLWKLLVSILLPEQKKRPILILVSPRSIHLFQLYSFFTLVIYQISSHIPSKRVLQPYQPQYVKEKHILLFNHIFFSLTLPWDSSVHISRAGLKRWVHVLWETVDALFTEKKAAC